MNQETFQQLTRMQDYSLWLKMQVSG